MCSNQSWILTLKVPFIISQPLIGFDMCWGESLATGQVGFKNRLAHAHSSVAQVPYQCLSSPISPWTWQCSLRLWRTLIPVIAKRLLCICCNLKPHCCNTSLSTGSQSFIYDWKSIQFYEINSVSLLISYFFAVWANGSLFAVRGK